MYDPFRAKMKVAFYTAAAALMGLGIASTLGWGGASHAMPAIGSEPQIPVMVKTLPRRLGCISELSHCLVWLPLHRL